MLIPIVKKPACIRESVWPVTFCQTFSPFTR